MVKRGLSEREVSWLGGVEPFWTRLDFPSYRRLRHRPGEEDLAMRPSRDLTAAEAARSPVVVAMLHLLRAASEGRAKLTASGNLSRSLVAALAGIVDGPAFDLTLIRSVTKVLNEIDVWPAELLRHVAVDARLVRRQGKQLVPTIKGREVLAADGAGDLSALMFETVFWRINLAHWDGYPVPPWPQADIGVIAWSLSQVAGTWQTPSRLVRLSTIPVIGVLEAEDDFAGAALELRILRMLSLFGLLDAQREADPLNRILASSRYRKTDLFDRFLSFDVTLEPIEGALH